MWTRKYCVDELFYEEENCFLNKIREFEEETEDLIRVRNRTQSSRDKKDTDDERKLLSDIETFLCPDVIRRIREMLPRPVLDKIQQDYPSKMYRERELQIKYIDCAISQVQQYDEFYFTSEDLRVAYKMKGVLQLEMDYFREKWFRIQ